MDRKFVNTIRDSILTDYRFEKDNLLLNFTGIDETKSFEQCSEVSCHYLVTFSNVKDFVFKCNRKFLDLVCLNVYFEKDNVVLDLIDENSTSSNIVDDVYKMMFKAERYHLYKID